MAVRPQAADAIPPVVATPCCPHRPATGAQCRIPQVRRMACKVCGILAVAPSAWTLRLRKWLPASRWQPLSVVAVPIRQRPRSCTDHARAAARFPRSGHELFRSEVRLPRPGQELPGRVCNFPDLILKTSDLETACPDLASNFPDLKSAGSDRVTNFQVGSPTSQVGEECFQVWTRMDPT